jgi:feruloyl esterase
MFVPERDKEAPCPHAPQVSIIAPTLKPEQPTRHTSYDIMLFALTKLSLCTLIQVGAAAAAAAATSSFEQHCLTFQPELIIPDARRDVLEYVPAGTRLTFPDNDASCNRGSQAVSENLCRIALSIKTSADSRISFEAWLPESWTGRFLATGNGGIDGCK